MNDESSARQPLDLWSQFVPDGTTALMLCLIFIAVFLAVLGMASLFERDPVQRRLAGAAPTGPAKRKGAEYAAVLRAAQSKDSRFDDFFEPLGTYFMDQKKGAQLGLRMRMLHAGFVGPNVVRNYVILRSALAVGVPAVFLSLLPAIAVDLPARNIAIITIILAMAGLYLPSIWISSRVDRRQQAIGSAFPDALDMMVVCVEAGLGLDAAFTRVATQIAPAHPILASELGIVALELRAGKSRGDALRNFSKRVGLREVGVFVTLLLQSDALGTSIGQTLRINAEEMRAHRMLRAEEMAQKLPVKLTVPLVICILPAMFAAVMLPGVITIIRIVLPVLWS